MSVSDAEEGKFLTAELQAQILALAPRYPTRQALTLPALHLVQERYRCVPPEAVVEIARLLHLAPAEVLDTLSFYGAFFHGPESPLGAYRVWVCRSLPCGLCGGEELLERLAGQLGIRPGQTTPDGRVTLEPAECLGACELAPCVWVNGEVQKIDSEQELDRLVTRLLGSAS
jgi:NADH-quinone oxidoreductase subunit E